MYGNYAPAEDVAEEASGSFDIQGLMRVAQHVSFQSNVQCCGSGMFIPDPIFTHLGSRMLKQLKKNLLLYLFL
jgi:hypothetical protein